MSMRNNANIVDTNNFKSWVTIPLKYVCDIYGGIEYTQTDFVDSNEGPIMFSPSNFVDGVMSYDKLAYISLNKYLRYPNSQIKNGDILYVKTGSSYGKMCQVNDLPSNATINPQIAVIKNIKVNPRFLSWFIASSLIKAQTDVSVVGGTIPTIGLEKIKNYCLLIPNADEQNIIADFLDNKNSKIKALIDNLNAQIESLKDYKKEIISEAVTKGLDPNVPLKDSGIESFGKIPSHWLIASLKNLFVIYSGATPKSDVMEYWDGDIVWITPADFKTSDKYISQGTRNISKTGYDSCSTTLINKGSIVFSKRAPIGSVSITSVPLCTNQGCLSCEPRIGVNPVFYYYVLSICTQQFEVYGSGTTFMEISATNFSSFKVVFPPFEEQNRIANYLDMKCAKIDKLIFKKQQAIDKLNEYSKSLIYEYVTGKKEVI